MPIKHQTNCYRNINGVRYENYSDLIYSEEENKSVIAEAKKRFPRVRVIDRGGFKAVFVARKCYVIGCEKLASDRYKNKLSTCYLEPCCLEHQIF